MRLLLTALLFLGMVCGSQAQTISYFNYGLLRQPSAAADRAYLGINGTNSGGTEVSVSWPLLASTNGTDPILVSLSFDQGFTNGLATVSYVDASGTIISNALFALIPSSSGALWATVVSAGTNALVLTNSASGTNNYTVNGLTDTNVVNSLAFVQAQSVTNPLATITFAESLTNNFDTIADVNAKTNALGQSIINATNGLAIANTNLWDPIGSAQNATNTARLAINLAGTFDALGAAQNATNGLAIANTNLWDPLGSAQNATNTARLAIQLAGSFDSSGAAQNATNGITSGWIQGKFPGVIVTNGNTVDVTMSNAFRIDAAHALSLSNATASRVAMFSAANQVTNVSASGAVPINADGTATTAAQVPGIGVDWTAGGFLPFTDTWNALAYGNGRFIAVAQSTNTAYSQDGSVWIANTTGSSQAWNDITFGAGQFAAVAASTTSTTNIARTVDGVNWTVSTIPYGNKLTSVTYGNGIYVAVGSQGTNEVFTSSDGATWNFQTAAASNQWQKVAFANNLFVAVSLDGSSRVMTSTNGTNWFSQSAANAVQWTSLTYGNGLWVAVANNGSLAQQVMTSPDGTNWTARTGVGVASVAVAYGDGMFVAVSGSGGTTSMSSPDGITWTARSTSGTGLAYGNHMFVVESTQATRYSVRPFANQTFFGNLYQGGLTLNGGMTLNGGFTNKDTLSATVASTDANGKLIASPLSFTTNNATLTSGRVQVGNGARGVADATASGAVPIDADGTATTAAQISALVTINSSGFTNNVNSQSANYSLLSTDWLVLLTGAHTATLPTAVGIGGRSYIIKCSSAGTNAILTTSSQTIDGAAKWTNTAINKFTWVISDNANWRVIGQN